MGLVVKSVAAGGLPVVETTSGSPVTESTNAFGLAVTKVVGKPGLPVTFETIGAGPVVPPAITPATWDAATAVSVTLSGGNLVATNTGTTSTNQGARVADSGGKSVGKFYFEVTITVANGGGNYGYGIGTITSTYPGMGASNGVVGSICFRSSGNIHANGVFANKTIVTFSVGQAIGIACDLDNRTIWYRKTPASNWNGDAAANPATNTGGVVFPAGIMVPFVTYGGSGGATGSASTANFGATAFVGPVPAGFTAGWLV